MDKARGIITPPGKGSLYFPVITTAAKISVMDFDSNQIDQNGFFPKPDNITITEVPWAIYRFSLPRSLWLPIFEPFNAISNFDLRDKHRKLDVFIVNVEYLSKFFEEIKSIVE